MKSAQDIGMYRNPLEVLFLLNLQVKLEIYTTKLCQITRFDPLTNLGPSVLDLSFEPTIHLGIHLKMPLGTRDLRNLQYLTEWPFFKQ